MAWYDKINGGPYWGLLGDSAKSNAITQGLLGLGSTMLQAGGPSLVPTSFGQALGAGIQNGMGQFNNAQAQGFMAQEQKRQLERRRAQQLAQDRYATATAMGNRDMAGRPVDRMGLLAQAYPEAYAQAELTREFAAPKTETPMPVMIAGRPGYATPSQINADPSLYRPIPKGSAHKEVIGPDGKPTFATDEQIANNPGMFTPITSGMTIVSDGQGGFTFAQGAGVGGMPEMTGSTQTSLDEAYRQGIGMLSSLNAIESNYRPEFSQFGAVAQAWGSGVIEKLGGTLPPEQQQFLSDYTTWRRNTLENVSTVLNQLSGAAVSPAEFERIAGTQPNEDDSPTQFRSKLDDLKEQTILATARAYYFRKQGYNKPEEIWKMRSLDGMKQLMNEVGDKAAKAYRQKYPNATDDQVKAAALAAITQEFGVNFR